MNESGPEDPPGERSVLEAFGRAVGREAAVLSGRPHLLWQQLANRVMWESEAGRALIDSTAAEPHRIWVRSRAPLPDPTALVALLQGHSGAIRACAVSPDSASFVSASDDGTLKVWGRSGVERLTIPAHDGPALTCAVGSSFIFSGGADAVLRKWDLASGARVWEFRGSMGPITACAIFPGERRVVSGGYDGALRVWDAGGSGMERMLGGGSETIACCAVSPDGKFIVSGATGGKLEIWNARTGELQHSIDAHGGVVRGCAVSPDAAALASVGSEGSVKLWDPATGEETRALAQVEWGLYACAFTPEGGSLVTAAVDDTVRVWSCVTGEESRRYRWHKSFVSCCAVSPDGTNIVSGDGDNTLIVWNPDVAGDPTDEPVHRYKDTKACVMAPDGSIAAIAGASAMATDRAEDPQIALWDEEAARLLRKIRGPAGTVQALAVAPDGRFFVSGGDDRALRLWGPAGELLQMIQVDHDVRGCAVSPGGELVASSGGPHAVHVWDAQSGSSIHVLARAERVTWACAFSPDGRLVFSIGRGGLTGHELPSGRCILDVAGAQGFSVAVSPDMEFLAADCGDGSIGFWRPHSGQEWKRLDAHAQAVAGLAVTPDAAHVVSASWDGTLKLWEAETDRLVLEIPLLDEVASVAVHPWRPRAVVGDRRGDIYFLEFEGVDYGPLVVTPLDGEAGPVIRCPRCFQTLNRRDARAPSPVACPRCGAPLRVNDFVARPIRPSRRRLAARLRRRIGRR